VIGAYLMLPGCCLPETIPGRRSRCCSGCSARAIGQGPTDGAQDLDLIPYTVPLPDR
jgi:hypothetical protein